MLELGQPIHGYDLAKLQGGRSSSAARATGETLETLDGTVRTLDPEDLVITDDSGPIGLAGVMGGASTEMSATTTDVLIEAANFDPVSIARTVRRHKLPSEAAKRFERGVDPRMSRVAARSASSQLLVELAGGTARPGRRDDRRLRRRRSRSTMPLSLPTSLVGVEYTDRADRLDARADRRDASTSTGDVATVTPPTWRPDLTDGPTLVEEVARIIGYDEIPSILPVAPPGRGLTRAQQAASPRRADARRRGRDRGAELPVRVGGDHRAVRAGCAGDRLANAARPAGAPAAPHAAARPARHRAPQPVARAHRPGAVRDRHRVPPRARRPRPAPTSSRSERCAPTTRPSPSSRRASRRRAGGSPRCSSATPSPKQPGAAAVPTGLTDALDVVRQLGSGARGRTDGRRRGASRAAPGPHRRGAGRRPRRRRRRRAAAVARGRARPAAHRRAASSSTSTRSSSSGATEIAAVPIGTLPAATQDLSLVVPVDVPAGDVLDAVVEGAGELLEHARLVDDYRGPGVPEGSKSITFALRFRAADRTLTAAEATEAKLAGAALAARALRRDDPRVAARRDVESAPVPEPGRRAFDVSNAFYFLPPPSRPPSRSPAIC